MTDQMDEVALEDGKMQLGAIEALEMSDRKQSLEDMWTLIVGHWKGEEHVPNPVRLAYQRKQKSFENGGKWTNDQWKEAVAILKQAETRYDLRARYYSRAVDAINGHWPDALVEEFKKRDDELIRIELFQKQAQAKRDEKEKKKRMKANGGIDPQALQTGSVEEVDPDLSPKTVFKDGHPMANAHVTPRIRVPIKRYDGG